jgi:Zn ribbon nucleic-acid-binding protein
MDYKCCSLAFNNLESYLKHLKFHKENSSVMVKCNSCGHSSKTWNAFKKHIRTEHTKGETSYFDQIDTNIFNPQEELLFENESLDLGEISSELNLQHEDNVLTDPVLEAVLDQSYNLGNVEINDFNSIAVVYATNLLELTYQHKMHETTVNRINSIIENVFKNLIQCFKVIF